MKPTRRSRESGYRSSKGGVIFVTEQGKRRHVDLAELLIRMTLHAIDFQPDTKQWVSPALTGLLRRPYGSNGNDLLHTSKSDSGSVETAVSSRHVSPELVRFSPVTERMERFRSSRIFSHAREVGVASVGKWEVTLDQQDDKTGQYGSVARLSFDDLKPEMQQLVIRKPYSIYQAGWYEPQTDSQQVAAHSYLFIMTQLASNPNK